MVKTGFSLHDLRKLDIDEFYSYVSNAIYLGEQKGEIARGTHSKITGKDNTVSELRQQLFKLKK